MILLTSRSSFHLDHASALPYVLAKTNFRGRVFMTHPTKAIYKWLIQDSVRVQYADAYPAAITQLTPLQESLFLLRTTNCPLH